MKNLIEYIEESLLDDFDTLSKNADDEIIKQEIAKFIKNNFYVYWHYKISEKPNNDGKYVVDCNGDVEIKNRKITSLVNDYFVWGKVDGKFDIGDCYSLTSLKGGPKEVGGNFYCTSCDIKSLEGAPEKVGKNFGCWSCESLTSLKGAPKKVGGNFDCRNCDSLKSYDVDSKIKGKFIKGEW